MELCVRPERADWPRLMSRRLKDDDSVRDIVRGIIDRVARDGDRALTELSEEIDGVRPGAAGRGDCPGLEVRQEEFDAAEAAVSREMKAAIEAAYWNIRRFHEAQMPQEVEVETSPGVHCISRPVPIRRVGLYVPGGSAPLFSTVLMLAVPARVAGCGEVILCTPPGKDGRVAPEVLCAARLCGVDRVFRVGGAQAVAAMAFGTETIPAVDKIFGPGNRYVTAAKQMLGLTQTAIDMPAGPSEVMVMADGSARADFVAADLLSQAEHGPDSQVVLLCLSEEFALEVREQISVLTRRLPRQAIAQKALDNSKMIVLSGVWEMVDFANGYAAEHLILAVENPWSVARRITSAGSVFIGNWSPESAGDYASGTNHTLPTSGWARAYSGVNTDSFFRRMTLQELTPVGLRCIGGTIMTMAAGEGLDAHRLAVKERLDYLNDNGVLPPWEADPDLKKEMLDDRILEDDEDYDGYLEYEDPYEYLAGTYRKWEDSKDGATLKLVRENVKEMEPYSTARDEFVGKPEICLDANENPNENGFNRYPDPHQKALKRRISEIKGVSPDRIFVGNGSDEAIDLCYRVFCRPGMDNAVSIAPSYGMYGVAANINDVEFRKVQLNSDFSLDEERLFSAVDDRTKLLFICSPNNPTGNIFPRRQIERVIRRFNGIVVLDEAYADFSSDGSMLTALDDYPNLIILQTMSKARGMAALRVGMAFASPLIAGLFARVKYPYNIGALTQRIVLKRLETPCDGQVAGIISERERVRAALETCPLVEKVWPSEANFLLVKFIEADKVGNSANRAGACARDAAVRNTSFAAKIYNALVSEGIIVRDRSRVPGCEGCLRITIGTPRENDRLLCVLCRMADGTAASAGGGPSGIEAGEGRGTRNDYGRTALSSRSATVMRNTSETQITVMLDLDGHGPSYISTGIGFFDHMLDQLVHHGGMSLLIDAHGDLNVDEHHTVEDVGIALGEAVRQALGDKAGIARYGFVLPMDESEARVLVDFGGRIDFRWDVSFTREMIGDMPTEMFPHFFKSFAEAARCNLHISASGENGHHKIEGVFKAFARAVRCGVALTGAPDELPSSKGVL